MRSAGDPDFLHRAVRSFCAAALCLCPAATGYATAPAGTMWVEEIGLERFSQRRGAPRVGHLRGQGAAFDRKRSGHAASAPSVRTASIIYMKGGGAIRCRLHIIVDSIRTTLY